MTEAGWGTLRASASLLGVLLCLAIPPLATVARAEDTAQARREANQAFQGGEAAFKQGDYARAAESFELANRRAPHPRALWNAARAWKLAGELARAANAYARYLRDAPPDAPHRREAIEALQPLSAKLGRIEVSAPGITDVAVDGRPIEGDRVYVSPGAHVVQGLSGARAVTRTAKVEAGAIVSVALVPEPPAATPEPPGPEIAGTPPVGRRPLLRGVPLGVLVGGGIATVAAGGVLLWSGIETQAALTGFNEEPTPQRLADGQDQQTRTNVLIGVTAGLGALTLGATLLLIDWQRGATVRAGLTFGPGGAPCLGLQGRL